MIDCRFPILGLLAGALVASTASASAQRGAVVKIEAIRAFLFYERTGQLSRNIAPPAKFEGHNAIIGEGDAAEPADDLLVTVSLVGPKDRLVDEVVEVSAVAKDGRVLGSRRFKSLLFGSTGKVTKALFVQNATCASIEIQAKTQRDKRTAAIAFTCGD